MSLHSFLVSPLLLFYLMAQRFLFRLILYVFRNDLQSVSDKTCVYVRPDIKCLHTSILRSCFNHQEQWSTIEGSFDGSHKTARLLFSPSSDNWSDGESPSWEANGLLNEQNSLLLCGSWISIIVLTRAPCSTLPGPSWIQNLTSYFLIIHF
jgi:hypothetical protein